MSSELDHDHRKNERTPVPFSGIESPTEMKQQLHLDDEGSKGNSILRSNFSREGKIVGWTLNKVSIRRIRSYLAAALLRRSLLPERER